MNKQAGVGIGIGLTLLLVLGGTVLWGLQSSNKKPQVLAQTSVSSTADNTTNSAMLNVQSSSAVPLGNLPGESGQASNASNSTGISMGNQGEPSTSSPNTGNTSSSQSATLDPTKFSEYDKYLNEKNALFGDIKAGSGDTASGGKTAFVNYRGWLTTGTLFDENVSTSNPFSFALGGGSVIPGWDQGIAGMKVGGERLIIVPPSVGYGANGKGPVPGNAMMVFYVKLLAVK